MKSKLLFVAACAFALSVRLPAAPAASESIEVSLRNMFKALDARDRAATLAYGPSRDTRFPVAAFDYDLDNKPVVFEGAEAVINYLGSLFDEMAKRKMKITSALSKLRSGSSSPVLLTQNKQTGKWRQFHWQATLIPMPAPASK